MRVEAIPREQGVLAIVHHRTRTGELLNRPFWLWVGLNDPLPALEKDIVEQTVRCPPDFEDKPVPVDRERMRVVLAGKEQKLLCEYGSSLKDVSKEEAPLSVGL
jgi:hypothetical protein